MRRERVARDVPDYSGVQITRVNFQVPSDCFFQHSNELCAEIDRLLLLGWFERRIEITPLICHLACDLQVAEVGSILQNFGGWRFPEMAGAPGCNRTPSLSHSAVSASTSRATVAEISS